MNCWKWALISKAKSIREGYNSNWQYRDKLKELFTAHVDKWTKKIKNIDKTNYRWPTDNLLINKLLNSIRISY